MASFTVRGIEVTDTEALWHCEGDVPPEGALLQLREPTNPERYRAGKASMHDDGTLFSLRLYSASTKPAIAPGPHWVLDFDEAKKTPR